MSSKIARLISPVKEIQVNGPLREEKSQWQYILPWKQRLFFYSRITRWITPLNKGKGNNRWRKHCYRKIPLALHLAGENQMSERTLGRQTCGGVVELGLVWLRLQALFSRPAMMHVVVDRKELPNCWYRVRRVLSISNPSIATFLLAPLYSVISCAKRERIQDCVAVQGWETLPVLTI